MKKTIVLLGLTGLALAVSNSFIGRKLELRRGAYLPGVSLSLYSSREEVLLGDEFAVAVYLDSKEAKVAGLDLRIDYDKSRLFLSKIEPLLGEGEVFSDEGWRENTEVGKARLVLVARRSDADLKAGSNKVALLRFRAKKAGEARMTINLVSQVLGKDELLAVASPQELLVDISDAFDPSRAVRVKLKVDFYGRVGGNETQLIKLRVENGKTDTGWMEEIPVYYFGDYYQSNWLTLPGVVPGENYRLIVKGPKHLARVYCGTTEKTLLCSEKNPGIVLDREGKDLNFSAWPLLPGDLPDPNNGFSQDGVVDIVDLVLIKNRLGSKKYGDLRVADVDLSGIIGGRDISLILAALLEEDVN